MLLPIIYLQAISFFLPASPPRFEAQTIDSEVSIGYGIALGDVDGDGKPDILLADKKQFVWYRNGDWKKFVLAENLTASDNVCIAARDIDGDGKVEVAVGAQWNPGETSDDNKSGAVFYLVRPADPTQPWEAVQLHHEPTTHRMRWVRASNGKFFLVVLPLHGRGNQNGEGAGVKVLAYEFPTDVRGEWPLYVLSEEMHLTHNLEVVEKRKTELYIAGKEGIRRIAEPFDRKTPGSAEKIAGLEQGAGELRINKAQNLIAAIEPMHGDKVVVYEKGKTYSRSVLDDGIREGHALAVADFLGEGTEQVVAGWRNAGSDGMTGIKLYRRTGRPAGTWEAHWIDKNEMACEDLQAMDLNGDGKIDIVAAGRATKNLKIYWNRR